jgi:cytochrome c oxidase subunit I
MLYAMVTGGVDTGWTFYTPFSTTYSNTHVVARRSASSSPASRRSHRIELHRHHPPHARAGHDVVRLPLFIWAHYATSIIMVLGTPVLAITLCWWLERAFISASSIPRWAATRSCSSICSGSIRTRPFTS